MLKNKKEKFSEWYSEVIQKAELADLRYNVRGFLVHRWWAVDIMKRMFDAYEKELDRTGHKEFWVPHVIPEANLKKEAEHAKGFSPQVFWIEKAGAERKRLEEPLVMRPTSETAMYTMYSLWIRSWRDLPFKRYQSGVVFRYEAQTRPFLRGREFYWIEAHDVFATKEGAEAQVKEDIQMTENIMHRQFGIPFIFFRRPKWDTFAGAERTYAADTMNPDGKSLQQPSTHFLGQNFARAFNVKFKDKDEKEQFAWQTCYGPAIWRMIASLIALHGDDKGLVLPFNLAPYQIVIVPIVFKGKEKNVLSTCRKVAQQISKAGYRAHVDDRDEYTAGSKFFDWEIRGVPLRIEIGPKDLVKKQVICVLRHSGKKQSVKTVDLIKYVKKIEPMVLDYLRKQADTLLKNSMREAKTFSQLESEIKKGGFVRVNWCSVTADGEPCAERIEKDLLARVRGIRVDKKEKPKTGAKCVICGKPAKHIVYVAKQY